MRGRRRYNKIYSDNKAKSVQLHLQLPAGTELGKKKKERCNSNDNFGNKNLHESKDIKQYTKIIELKEKESNLEGQINEPKEKLKTETENEDEVMNTKSRQMSDLLKMIYNLEDVYS